MITKRWKILCREHYATVYKEWKRKKQNWVDTTGGSLREWLFFSSILNAPWSVRQNKEGVYEELIHYR